MYPILSSLLTIRFRSLSSSSFLLFFLLFFIVSAFSCFSPFLCRCCHFIVLSFSRSEIFFNCFRCYSSYCLEFFCLEVCVVTLYQHRFTRVLITFGVFDHRCSGTPAIIAMFLKSYSCSCPRPIFIWESSLRPI